MRILSIFLLILTRHVYHVSSDALDRVARNVICEDISEMELIKILGPAYNARYMSIEDPMRKLQNDIPTAQNKRTTFNGFYVRENYSREITDEPAWNVDHYQVEQEKIKGIIQTDDSKNKRMINLKDFEQWECEAVIHWKDLGGDYFPRYLRSVECVEKRKCWYGHFACQPKSFTLKLLKRRHDKCVSSLPKTKIGTMGLPPDLRQLWVWEEHAVNFCCECSFEKKKNHK